MPHPHICYVCGEDLGGSYMMHWDRYCHCECHPDTVVRASEAERHYQRGKADVQATIDRLTAERDAALAREAAAFEVAAQSLDEDVADREADASRFRPGSDPHHYRMALAQAVKYHSSELRKLVPADSQAALDRMLREAEARGMRKAADLLAPAKNSRAGIWSGRIAKRREAILNLASFTANTEGE